MKFPPQLIAGKQRMVWLDVLRAIAIFLVIGSHLEVPPSDSKQAILAVTSFLSTHGSLGVDLFFVLSGFLVSGLLFREYQKFESVRVGQFLIRRGLKLYPAFYAFLLVSVALRLAAGDQISPQRIAAELLFVQNYFQGVWSHTWSLAVEEHFYILIAIAIAFCAQRRIPDPFGSLPLIFLGATSLVLYWRYATFVAIPYSFRTHRCPTHLQFDSLLFGTMLSYFYTFQPRWREFFTQYRSLLMLGGLAAVSCFFTLDGVWAFTVGHVLVYLGFGAIVVVAALARNERSNACVRFIAYIGSHSYSIYLWHTAVLVFGRRLASHFTHLEMSWLAGSMIYVCAAVGWGIVMANLVEIPVLRLRNRLFPSRTPNPLAASAPIASVGS